MDQKMKENLNFYKENGYTNILTLADQVEHSKDELDQVVKAIATDQIEKNPKEMHKEERDKWHKKTLSKLVKVNQMLQGTTMEVQRLRKIE